MKKVIIANVTAKSGCEETLVAKANELVKATREEIGCITYEFLRDTENPQKFRFVEVWSSQASVDAHFHTPHFQAFLNQSGGLIAEPNMIMLYDIAAERSI
ncbi:MAG: antibiotic biosynthesis monooxygenase [Puniceicoccales bacterium]|nr:antibiotic biosynthesis monooxygenase [Puniceicoccales bacterium]